MLQCLLEIRGERQDTEWIQLSHISETLQNLGYFNMQQYVRKLRKPISKPPIKLVCLAFYITVLKLSFSFTLSSRVEIPELSTSGAEQLGTAMTWCL